MIKGFSVTQVLLASGVSLSPSSVWDSAGTTFTGIKFDVTDTASAAASLLMDLQVGGTSKFKVAKSGATEIAYVSPGTNVAQIVFKPTSGIAMGLSIGNGGSELYVRNVTNNLSGLLFRPNAVDFGSNGYLRWTNANNNPATTTDVGLYRDAAGILAQREGAFAQTKRVYGTYTDASNYRRVAIGMTTGGVASIAPEGAGTGASGNVLHISGLPTANPGPGILWNNGGTVEVGT